MKHKSIHDLLDAFLAKRSRGDDYHMAEVTEEEIEKMTLLFDKIIKAKYRASQEGNYPIDLLMVDRNTCLPIRFRPLPRDFVQAEPTAGDMIRDIHRFEIAHYNLDVANEEFRQAVTWMKPHLRELEDSALDFIKDTEEETKATGPVVNVH